MNLANHHQLCSYAHVYMHFKGGKGKVTWPSRHCAPDTWPAAQWRPHLCVTRRLLSSSSFSKATAEPVGVRMVTNSKVETTGYPTAWQLLSFKHVRMSCTEYVGMFRSLKDLM